ncbi:regulator of chromosome condensation, putative [Talaromyces stipitatus ATCC 10500]|uniref:Regulator of chromosome condensation, putative n=1 Tax=Talaromyces stipitatus (strain ATCC 10500 / CBS 375.48 / QM 6759 / NRRL 1006) TaxID=441959 RepID=B8MML9_TALSN|nr:regulator of chromosome condensation, putative [Talaromyces stipitatus ATCC 10500]EED13773.1 regulator of chromosome condensation, putative [Talaromyces stipitatus ATCC 10500]
MFGINYGGKLGLGDATKKLELPGPVLNQNLSTEAVGVVQLAAGEVHSAALTHSNRILTWAANDEGTLGRDTIVESKKTPIDATSDNGEEDDDDDDDEVELNLKEATPLPVDSSHVPEDGTVFTQLVTTDSATFALTNKGLVYSWGTFRDNNGTARFSPKSTIQRAPALIPDLKDVVKLVAGAQHVSAPISNDTVFSWGIYHSFSIRKTGHLYAWGSNNFGQTGVFQSAGQSDAVISYPTPVPSLEKGSGIVSVTGGKDHSLVVTEQGQCLVWGRIDNNALDIIGQDIPTSDIIFDTYNKPRILKVPTPISSVDGKVVFTAAGTDHSFAIIQDGRAYSWGFNAQRQVGHRNEEEDEVELPTQLKNRHVSGKMLVSVAAGGQFSIFLRLHEPQAKGPSNQHQDRIYPALRNYHRQESYSERDRRDNYRGPFLTQIASMA